MNGHSSAFGSGLGVIMLDNVVCTGAEESLLQCSHNNIMSNNCDHKEDAAVICGSKYKLSS